MNRGYCGKCEFFIGFETKGVAMDYCELAGALHRLGKCEKEYWKKIHGV